MVLRFQSLEVERTRKMKANRGRTPPYIEGNPSTAFAARLIPQYESHIRVTKETIQFVVNLTKEIPHSNRVTKERTPKLSHHVSHQGTVRPCVLCQPTTHTYSYPFQYLTPTTSTIHASIVYILTLVIVGKPIIAAAMAEIIGFCASLIWI